MSLLAGHKFIDDSGIEAVAYEDGLIYMATREGLYVRKLILNNDGLYWSVLMTIEPSLFQISLPPSQRMQLVSSISHGVCWICTRDGNGLAKEIDILIICSGINNYSVTTIGIVYCRLYGSKTIASS